MSKITVGGIIGSGFQRGFKNLIPIAVNIILWIVTIWIPYLNVGTTIGVVLMAAKMSRGESVAIGEIFKGSNRKRMGDFFLTAIFIVMGVYFGLIFLIIPGFVLGLSWYLAILLCVDKEMNPMESLSKSNSSTYGHKWTMFFGFLLLWIIILAVVGGITFGCFKINHILGIIVGIILYLIAVSVALGSQSYVYGELTKQA